MNRAQTQYVMDRELIERYTDRFKAFGQLPFQKEVGDRAQGCGNPECFALPNEGQRYLPARFVNLDSLMKGELAENEFRKEFTASERIAIGEAIERELGDRRLATLKQGASPVKENFPEREIGQTRDIAAKAAGLGNGKTVERGDVDPHDFVLTQNKARRNLTASQRAAAVTSVNQRVAANVGRPRGELSSPLAKTNAELAAIAGTAVRSIPLAKAVHSGGVKTGAVTVQTAAAVAKLPAKGPKANPRAAISPAPLSASQPHAKAEGTEGTRSTAFIHAGSRVPSADFSEGTEGTKWRYGQLPGNALQPLQARFRLCHASRASALAFPRRSARPMRLTG